ncbi:MAG: hypothetical protein ACRCXZ_10370 [Patescibacteria group bacterium]
MTVISNWLNTSLDYLEDDDKETIEEWLEVQALKLNRSANGLNIMFFPVLNEHCKAGIDAICKVFESNKVLSLSIPDNHSLMKGIFGLIEDVIAESKIPDDYCGTITIIVENFTQKAVQIISSQILSEAQPFTHLYAQNTGEDLSSTFSGTKSQKSFESKGYNVLLLNPVTDVMGSNMQESLVRWCYLSDFSTVVPNRLE